MTELRDDPRPIFTDEGLAEQDAPRTEDWIWMKIFVVDDDASLLGFIKRWLASLEGHEVRIFENGASAIEALMTEPPCLLVSDLEMPGMSGEDVARAAARLPRPPRIVLMSGDRERLRRAQALAQATLDKPFSFKDLLSVIETAACVSSS